MAIFNNILIPLWVLLWKYVKVGCCRYWRTIWETFGGAFMFIMLCLVHHINLFDLHSEIKDPDETRRMLESSDSLVRVFYSPINNFTQSLMTLAEAHLDQDLGILPKYRWNFESIVFPIKLQADFFKTSVGLAEVEFKESGSLPTSLEYSLYAVSDEATNKLNSLFNGVLRTITPKEEIVRPYLAQLQWAIDKSYMERLNNQNIRQEIIMSSIPNFIKGELITLHRFMILCTILGPLPFFIVYSSRLVVERRTAMKELMKHSGIYPNVLLISHVLEVVLVGTLYSTAVTLLLKMTSQPILPESNAFIIGATIVWHFVNTMCLAIITTALSQDLQHADCLGLFLYLSTFILDFLWYTYKKYTYLVACFLPHAPVYLFWDEVLHLERVGVGTQISNIFTSHSENKSVVKVWTFFGIQLAVTMAISWYIVQTRPGYYGVPKSWNFFVKGKYWNPKIRRKVIQLPSSLDKRDEINFEKKPKKADIAVQVLNVSKVFKQHGSRVSQVIALDSVTFDCYKGEVTILLGGNGAGKTTLMLIVAGMFSATEGTVFVEGVDVANRDVECRTNLGICMQQNIYFKHLTVRENITFFKKLQERPKKEGFSVQQLLKSLKLAKVANNYGSELTSGNMRCLQVACVLASDADVLVLDEPTTGIDLEARHQLWDLLMLLRGNKTILMTTTCLEEANALGDRIAILDKGVLKCHGSPSFLKNIIGTSFTLTITIKEAARLYELKETVDRIMPGLECRIKEMRRVSYLLPTKEFQRFPTLFEALEDKKDHLGIIVIDVAMFMEEVFQKYHILSQ